MLLVGNHRRDLQCELCQKEFLSGRLIGRGESASKSASESPGSICNLSLMTNHVAN